MALSGGNSGPDFAAIWRAAPLDGSDPDSKAELAPFPKAYFNSTGFPAPTSPIAVYTDLNDIFLRRWNGSGAYNDPANWTAEEQVAHGTEPKLASGASGVYLIYRGLNPPYQYFVRRFDGQNFPEDPGKAVSDPGSGQSARFRDFFQDGNGNLHAVFLQASKTGAQGLRHRVSEDGPDPGVSWKWGEVTPSPTCPGSSPFAQSSVARASKAGVSFPAGLIPICSQVEWCGDPVVVGEGPNRGAISIEGVSHLECELV